MSSKAKLTLCFKILKCQQIKQWKWGLEVKCEFNGFGVKPGKQVKNREDEAREDDDVDTNHWSPGSGVCDARTSF